MSGVKATYWGWAPATGPLYLPYFLFFNGFMIYGLHPDRGSTGASTPASAATAATLILLGTCVSLTGGIIDFARFILARFVPAADLVYPVGIPANMVFALMLGTSIVRYRLFDVAVAVKKTAVYALVGAVITILLGVVTAVVEDYFDLEEASALWVIVPLGAIMTMLLSPAGPAARRPHPAHDVQPAPGLLRDAAAPQQADELDPGLQRAGGHAGARAGAAASRPPTPP